MSQTSKSTFGVGDVLGGKWVVLELLGRGGMGEVYRVHQLNLKRDVAVKVISTRFLQEIADDEYEAETYLERFSREVQVMAQVRHPNVLQIFDSGSISVVQGDREIPVQYIAMEYVPGGDLRSTMSSEGFYPDEDRMREWLTMYFLPLLDGVQALHAAGIIHRDLKPENVLLDGFIPKITDFGLSRSYRSRPVTQSVDMRGTPPYMSPEHFLDLKRTDGRTDVYALGKILYEAASGKMDSDQIPFKQARLKDPQTSFYQQLDRVIQETTAEDRNERVADVKSLKQAIQAVLTEADKIGPAPEEDRQVKKVQSWRDWAVRAVLVLVVILATGLAVIFFHKRDYVPPTPSVQPSLPASPQNEASKRQSSASSPAEKVAGPAQVLQGKDEEVLRLIPGGTVVVPEHFNSEGGRTVRVDPFYLDETEVTNQQYVHFLNRVASRIKVEDGVVRGDDDRVWLLLGEVMEGYEPIVYQKGQFIVRNAGHSACPVLRVTAYGALAYARFYGERLMTGVEWLMALKGGGAREEKVFQSPAKSSENSGLTGMHGMMEPSPQSPPPKVPVGLQIPLPVILFEPNEFGIRGLNGSISEWGVEAMDGSQREEEGAPKYVVLGGILNKLESGDTAPSAVRRHPWEAHATVGFRCALSLTGQNR